MTMARKRYTLEELNDEKILVCGAVSETFTDWDTFKHTFMQTHPESSEHIVAKNTATKFKTYSIKKKIGCLVYDGYNQGRECVITHWDCIVNENILTSESMGDIFDKLTGEAVRTKKENKLGQVKSETASLNEELEKKIFCYKGMNLFKFEETYQCYGVYITWHKQPHKDYVNITFKYRNITNAANNNRPEDKPFEALLLNIHVKNPAPQATGVKTFAFKSIISKSTKELMKFLSHLRSNKLAKKSDGIHKFYVPRYYVEIDAAMFTIMKPFGTNSKQSKDNKIVANNREDDGFRSVTNVSTRKRKFLGYCPVYV